MASERLQVILELVTSQFKREAREAASATGQIGDAAKSATGPVGALASRGTDLTKAYKGFVGAAAGAALVSFAADSIRAASNLGESVNAVNKVFGDASGVIENFGQVSANAVGLSTREFNQLATVTGSMLTNLGFNAREAGQETITLTQRAADMASVFNTDVGTALDAINSALKGEANPIEQFGVKLNDAAVRARAVELGLAATTAQVDANAKATATLSLIYEQTSKTQGDFASTSDDLANAQRRAAAAMENAQARFGTAVTPALANLMDRFAEGIERVAAAFGDEAAAKSIVFNEAMMGINTAMAEGTLGAEDLADSLLHIATNSNLSATDFQTLAGAVGLAEDQWSVFAPDVIAQAKAMGVAPEVIRELEEALKGALPALVAMDGTMARYTTTSQGAADATDDFSSALAAADDAELSMLRAEQQVTDARSRFVELTLSGTASVDELRVAQLELNIATRNAELATIAYNKSLTELDGKQVNVTINTLMAFQNAQREAVEDAFVGGRQHGGPVSAGRPYLVGERGPELMVPNQNGTILPHGWTRPNGPVININSPTTQNLAQDLQLATILATVNTMVEVQG